jgi:hypothetical protein
MPNCAFALRCKASGYDCGVPCWSKYEMHARSMYG